jgi:hypothetical protein
MAGRTVPNTTDRANAIIFAQTACPTESILSHLVPLQADQLRIQQSISYSTVICGVRKYIVPAHSKAFTMGLPLITTFSIRHSDGTERLT